MESENILRSYVEDISRESLLSADEEKELATAARAGDRRARDRMAECNLRLVISVAKAYIGRGVPFLDLIGEGNLGLLKAIDRFDPERGCRFSSYAVWWIRQAIGRAVQRQSSAVRIPSHMSEKMSKVHKAKARLYARLGRTAVRRELRHELGLSDRVLDSIQRATAILKASNRWPTGTAAEKALHLTVDEKTRTPEQTVLEADAVAHLHRLIGRIDERRQLILRWRFGLDGVAPQTLVEIGKRLNISKERVRQILQATFQDLEESA